MIKRFINIFGVIFLAGIFLLADVGLTPVQAQAFSPECPSGTGPSGSNLVTNGNFAIGAGPGPGIAAAAGFTSDIPNAGDGVYPTDTYLSIQDGPISYAGGDALADGFPGDPVTGAPASSTYLYSNGNDLYRRAPFNPPAPYIFWRQTITGLTPNTDYLIYSYHNNIVRDTLDAPDDPIIEYLVDGVQSSITLSPPEDPDIWVRLDVGFRTGAAQTQIVLEIRDNQLGYNGDDLATTQISMQECLPLALNPGIRIRKSVDNNRANVGDTVTYTYVVTNTGNVRLDGITVNDDRLGPITLVATSLNVGESTTGTATYTILAGDLPLTNIASVSGNPPNGAPPVTDSDRVTVRPPGSGNNNNGGGGDDDDDNSSNNNPPPQPVVEIVDPFITKSVQPPFAVPGESVTWTITIRNPGTVTATNVTMTDNLPGEVEILEVSATSGNVSFSGQTVNFSIGSLAGGASVTITVRTRVRDGAAVPFIINNQACMSSSINAGGNCAQATLVSAGQLPATGQSPWSVWRLPVLSIMVTSTVWLWQQHLSGQ